MFPLFGGSGEDTPSHEEAIEEDIQAVQSDPFTEIVAADHTDMRRDPNPVNGRIPDEVRRNTLTGERTFVEKESHPESKRSQRQMSDLRAGTDDDVVLEPLDDSNDFFDL